jgi:hypothetical protein
VLATDDDEHDRGVAHPEQADVVEPERREPVESRGQEPPGDVADGVPGGRLSEQVGPEQPTQDGHGLHRPSPEWVHVERLRIVPLGALQACSGGSDGVTLAIDSR